MITWLLVKIANYEQLILKLHERHEVFWKTWDPFTNIVLKNELEISNIVMNGIGCYDCKTTHMRL